jgi:tRNA-splicing ligase RtcB
MNPSTQSQKDTKSSSTTGPVPIRCFGGENLLPDELSRAQLEELAAMPGVEEYVTVLPDVNYKDRNPCPSGTAFVTTGVIMPRAVDDGINCGMRAMVTNIQASAFTPEVMDDLFGRIMENVPVKRHAEPLLTPEQAEDMLVHGMPSLVESLGLPADELDRTESRGVIDLGATPEEIRAALPKKPITKYRESVGALGAGNHFLELQEVVEICDEEAAARLGLTKGLAVFMMHSDSGKLGKRVLRPVHAEAEAAFRKPGASELFSIPVDSDIGRRYLACLTASTHAGFANRAAITNLVRQSLAGTLEGATLSLVGDSGHETILPEMHHGRTMWVHRHGASHALPPSLAVADPALRDLGNPVPLAGCLGADSYICLGMPGNEDTFHSAPHGAGRVLSKVDSAEKYDPDKVEQDVQEQGVRLYRYHSDNIAGQARQGFKNVEDVVNVMSEQDLLRPVVRLRPLAALKG